VQSFMVGGLVSYEDTGDGVFLLKKETLDKMMPTIEGRPVILGHKSITLDNLEENAVGYVTKGWFNTETGQFDCEILVKDSDVYDDIKNGNNKVSSAYQVTKLGEGGKYLGQDYEAEILDGTFTHLAIVENPRYPDAKILINSLNGDKEMGLFNLKNNNENAIEITAEDTVEYMGKTYSIGELVNSYVFYNEDDKDKDNEDDEKKDEEEVKDNEEEEEKKNRGNCKRNEDKDKDNEDEDDEKKNEDSDDELVEKVTKIVKRILAEKEDEEEEKKDKDNEDDEKKENRNSLRLRNSYLNPRSNVSNISTRAERIKMSNQKYGI